MDSIISKTIIPIVVISILLLAACTLEAEKTIISNETQVESTDPSETPGLKDSIPDHALSEEQVKLAYQQAVEAYRWFDVTTMPVDVSDTKEYSATVYYRVNHETIKTYADLKNYLHDLFTDDIVEQLLSQADVIMHYADIDGALYAVVADRGSDICKGDETHKIIYENDNKIIYRVEVEVLDFETRKVIDRETHDFIYERLDNKWVFSEFYLVR